MGNEDTGNRAWVYISGSHGKEKLFAGHSCVYEEGVSSGAYNGSIAFAAAEQGMEFWHGESPVNFSLSP
jgi:hypothetical protein